MSWKDNYRRVFLKRYKKCAKVYQSNCLPAHFVDYWYTLSCYSVIILRAITLSTYRKNHTTTKPTYHHMLPFLIMLLVSLQAAKYLAWEKTFSLNMKVKFMSMLKNNFYKLIVIGKGNHIILKIPWLYMYKNVTNLINFTSKCITFFWWKFLKSRCTYEKKGSFFNFQL